MSLYLLKTWQNFTSGGHGHFMFVVWPLLCSSPKVKTGNVFPTFCHAMVWWCAVMYPEQGTIIAHDQMYHNLDTFDFSKAMWPRINQWQSLFRNIAVNIVIESIVGLTLVRTVHVQVLTGFLSIGNGRCHRGRVSYIYDHPLISESYGQCPSRTCRYCYRASWT